MLAVAGEGSIEYEYTSLRSVQAARAVYPERSEGLAEYEYEHDDRG